MSPPAPVSNGAASGKTRGAAASLGVNTTLYTAGNLLTKSIGFLLTLVLSWLLAPEAYGVWGIALSAGNLLTVLLGLSMESAIRQMYVHYSEAERKRLYGTLLAFWLTASGLATLALDQLGRMGRLNFIPSLPFDPYLRLVLWTSFLNLFVNAPQTIYLTRQEPARVVRLAVGQALLTALCVLLFTVQFAGGVTGVLTGYLVATALMAAISVGLMVRLASARFSWKLLRTALRFSLPLVPHSASNWVMNMSDRMIMDRFVPSGQIAPGQIGHYNLGFQFGMLVSTFAMSVNNAFFPIADQCLSDPRQRARVPALGTYALGAICLAGLVVALLGGEIIRLATPERHHGAAVVVPWLALAFVFQGVYFIWSRGTWYAMKTAWMPAITGGAAILGAGLNLLLIPRFGIRVAGIDLAVALAFLALANGWLASKTCPIAWEYRRWAQLFAAGLICFGIGHLAGNANPWRALMVKGSIGVLGFPALLAATGFFTPDEWRRAQTWLRQRGIQRNSPS
jgi:O-antigen/teichoic acid export membrane protein